MLKPKAEKLLDRLNAGHYLFYVNTFGRAECLQICSRDYMSYVNDIWGAGGQYGQSGSLKEPGMYMVTIDRYGHATEVISMSQPEKKSFIAHVLGARF